MSKKIRLSENDLVRLIQKIILEQAQIVQGSGGDPYQYKEENGTYSTARKGSDSWIEATDPNVIKKIKSLYFTTKTGSSKVGGSSSYDKGKKLGSQHKKAVGKFIEDTVETIVTIGQTVFKFVKSGLVGFGVIIYGVVVKLPQLLFEAMLKFLGALAKKIKGIVIGAAKQVKKYLQDVWQKAKQDISYVLKKIWDAIKSLGQKAWTLALLFASKVKVIWNQIKDWAIGAWNAVKNTYQEVAREAEQAWEGVKGYFAGWLSEDVELALEWYNYYSTLPTNRMLQEIKTTNRRLV